MASLTDILQKYVNADYDTLVTVAQKALTQLLPACREVDPENDGFLMASGIILAAVGADGVLSSLEKKFVCDVLGIKSETFDRFLKLYNEGLSELVDKFADTLEGDVKANTLTLVASVAACDEKITLEESAFIRKILD
ncbi:MAG: hypothetical protein E7647_06120 [Ruminococcaceae bacterium]|nr:hypothetical protein [Oscillospiraceae bacterium]